MNCSYRECITFATHLHFFCGLHRCTAHSKPPYSFLDPHPPRISGFQLMGNVRSIKQLNNLPQGWKDKRPHQSILFGIHHSFFLQDIVNAAWMRLRSKIPTTEFSADGQVSVLPLPDQLQNNERFNCSTKNVNGLLVRTRSSASPPIVCWGEWHKKCNHLRTCQF